MGCDVSLHTCQKQQQRCSGGETSREPEHIRFYSPRQTLLGPLHLLCQMHSSAASPRAGIEAHLVLGEPPKHMGPQGISTAEQKPRQAKGQLGLSEGEWGPTRQQGLEKTELHWADIQLLFLGSCGWQSSPFPSMDASSWQGQSWCSLALSFTA